MPPALPPAQSRPWWSRSKSSKDSLRPIRSVSSLADEDEKYPSPASSTSSKPKDALSTLKFNTLASAIGFKSKKLPALTIQDPPSPLAPIHPYPISRSASAHSTTTSPNTLDRTPFYTNRPPAKSISTVRSSEYDYDAASSEPRTPSDHPRDRLSYQQSVMTFSEIDPFASGSIVLQQLPQDPNRLSVYSDSSLLDPQHKRPDAPAQHRVSYGSSSSNHSDVQALSPVSPNSFARPPTASRSAYDLSQTHDPYYVDMPVSPGRQSQRTRRAKTPSGSDSSNFTVTQNDYRSRLSEPSGGHSHHLPRKRSSPTLTRPRGMTAGSIDYRPGPHPAASTTLNPTQPLQPRRKASKSSSPSSSGTPSPSPVTFSRARSTSTSTSAESPISPGSKRPLVLVRKASSSRLPPLPAAPPTSDLPPPPVPSSPYGTSPLEFRASSSSSSLNFASSVDLDLHPNDPIAHLLSDHYDLGPFEAQKERHSPKGKTRKNRNTYILDGDLSPTALVDSDANLPSPLSRFPAVPATTYGEALPKAGKLLRKMSSQQYFSQRYSAAGVTSTVSSAPPEPNGHYDGHAGKTPRKQRSFHASRVPLPPLPGLRNGSSSANGHPSASVETFPQSASPIVEPRRSSVTSPRKRLFSGSSARRSTSSQGPASVAGEDDKRSVFSFESDIRPSTSSGVETITMSFGTTGGPLSLMTKNACIAPSSFWSDSGGAGGGEKDNKRASHSEYIPQYIMSPAEQLKLAEELEVEEAIASVREPESEPEFERKPKLDLQPGDFGLAYSVLPSAARSRSNSVLSNQSTGTLAFGEKGIIGVSRGTSVLSTKPSIMSAKSRPSLTIPTSRTMGVMDPVRLPARTTSMLARSVNKPPSLSARPSTAQASLTPPTTPTSFSPPAHSPQSPSASLPPPPRRRPSRHNLQEIEEVTAKRNSVVHLNPLSPPPSRAFRLGRQVSSETMTTVASSLPPSSFDRQKTLQRRSLMKKPSFLDIEDEADVNVETDSDDEVEEVPSPESPAMESSFLIMDPGKSSFDTVRSVDNTFYM